MEDPVIIRMNIRHYQELLKLCGDEKRNQVLKLLGEAQAQLPLAIAEALGRKH